MGLKERDKTDTTATQESRDAMPNETRSPMAKESPKLTSRSPDLRRRALIAGLATTPVLLSLTNRSALGQTVDCSLLSSVMLGGSVDGLPPGLGHSEEAVRQNYEKYCAEGDEPNGNNGNSGSSGNSGNSGG